MTELEPVRATKGVLSAYKAAAPAIAAMSVATELRERVRRTHFETQSNGSIYSSKFAQFMSVQHEAWMVRSALESRNKLLPYFRAADEAVGTLNEALDEDLDRTTTVAMISAMLGALGAKGDKEALAGMVELIEDDDLARATKLWKPLEVVPVTLAIACRKLIATCKFVPKPVELADACREAMTELRLAYRFCEALTDYIRKCDALVLEFAPEQWREPYRLPTSLEYRVIGREMLDSHALYGNGDEEFLPFVEYDDEWPETEKNRSFRLALERARKEFPKLPPASKEPEPPPAIEQTEEPAKVAACAKPVAKRRSKKIKDSGTSKESDGDQQSR